MREPRSQKDNLPGEAAPEATQSRQPDPLDKSTATDVDTAHEIGGFDGPEPTRYGDWEHNGRCTDF